MENEISKFEEMIGIKFNNQDLLRQSMVHRSFLNENPDFELDHNERLEFLGDAVLELITTEFLYNNYPNPEGELTNWRASLVNSEMLSKKAREMGVEDFLYLSHGEQKSIGKARDIILANAFEAILGALYLDTDYDTCKKFLEKILLPELPRIIKLKLYLDPKTHFQEVVQEKLNITPTYQVVKEWGPDHKKNFIIGIMIGDKQVAEGEGGSKQEAQINAAKNALDKLDETTIEELIK